MVTAVLFSVTDKGKDFVDHPQDEPRDEPHAITDDTGSATEGTHSHLPVNGREASPAAVRSLDSDRTITPHTYHGGPPVLLVNGHRLEADRHRANGNGKIAKSKSKTSNPPRLVRTHGLPIHDLCSHLPTTMPFSIPPELYSCS